MRFLYGAAVLAALVSFSAVTTSAQTTEVAVGATWTEHRDMGYRAGQAAVTASGRLAVNLWDISAGVTLSELKKECSGSTGDGHQETYSLGVRRWLGPDVFIGAAVDQVHSDAVVWERDTTFVGGTAGFAFRSASLRHGRHQRSEVGLKKTYEVHSSLDDPYHAKGFGLFWEHTVPVSPSADVRGYVQYLTWGYRQVQPGVAPGDITRYGDELRVGVTFVREKRSK